MENTNKEFHYTYSAKEQEEIKKIRQKYQPQEEDKIERLRKLDAGVTSKATTYSLVMGILGALIMGSGMSLVMTEIGGVIGLSGMLSMVIGIIIGVIGMILVICAYPVYSKTMKREREKISPEVLRLTEELLK